MTGIYKITNKINGKVYIGQSVNIQRRWRNHKSAINDSFPIHKAFKKYGLENFDFEVLEECCIEDLSKREQYYILYFNSLVPNGYNIVFGDIHQIKLTPDRINEIIKMLKETTLNSEQIGSIFGVSGRTVRAINSGESWKNDNYIYPIRDKLYKITSHLKEIECKQCKKLFNPKNSQQIYCSVECSQRSQRKVERPSKEELYKLIKNNSFVAVGKMFNVSDNAIRKWCKEYNLPSRKKDLK